MKVADNISRGTLECEWVKSSEKAASVMILVDEFPQSSRGTSRTFSFLIIPLDGSTFPQKLFKSLASCSTYSECKILHLVFFQF